MNIITAGSSVDVELKKLDSSGYFNGANKLTEGLLNTDFTESVLENTGPSGDFYAAACSGTGRFMVSADGKSGGGYVYVSSDYGANWAQKESERLWRGCACSASGKYMLAVCITSGHIYLSSDFGATWTEKGDAHDYFSCHISADGQYMMAAVYGGGYIYVSSDYGATWIQRASSKDWRTCRMSSDAKIMVAASYNGGSFLSVNYGVSWSELADMSLGYGITVTADGTAIFAHIAGGGDAHKIAKTTDLGVSWTLLPDITSSYYVIGASSDGRVLCAKSSTTAFVYISQDYGATWQAMDIDTSIGDLDNLFACDMSYDGKYIVIAGGASRTIKLFKANVTPNTNLKTNGRLLSKTGADVASGTQITLGSGNYFVVTGTTTIERINSLGWTAGSHVFLQFTGTLDITPDTSPSGTYKPIKLIGYSGTISAGSVLLLLYDGTSWILISRTSEIG